MRFTTLTLETITESVTGAVEFVFQPKRPLSYRAGQGGLVFVPGAGAKPFTFSSAANAGVISVATSLQSGSRFKLALGRLRPGNRVHAAGAIGTLPELDASRSQVLVAQGIGITPFLSMARTHRTLNASLLQVGSAHYFDETAAAMASAERCAHRDELHDAIGGKITARPDAYWSLSGRADFVAGIARQLAGAGVPARRVHKDAFWGMHAVIPPLTERNPTLSIRA